MIIASFAVRWFAALAWPINCSGEGQLRRVLQQWSFSGRSVHVGTPASFCSCLAAEHIRERVARINVCLFCIDIARSFIIKSKLSQAKCDALDDYETSPLFSDAERAALDYVTELTRDKDVKPATFQRLAQHFSERQICEIVWLVASEHIYNITNIGLNIHSDMLCALAKRRTA